MKTKNTYSLLVNSEEKNRSIFETAVYTLVVGSMAFSVFAFASQSVTLPRKAAKVQTAPAVEIVASPAPLVASRG